MEKQELRNALCLIEDVARAKRNTYFGTSNEKLLFDLITQLTQLIRQEIVK